MLRCAVLCYVLPCCLGQMTTDYDGQLRHNSISHAGTRGVSGQRTIVAVLKSMVCGRRNLEPTCVGSNIDNNNSNSNNNSTSPSSSTSSSNSNSNSNNNDISSDNTSNDNIGTA